MSFRITASGRRFAIDGELGQAVRQEKQQLAAGQTGGGPLATKSLDVLTVAVDEILKTAPHDCDVRIDLWGERDAGGMGGVTLELTISPHEAPAIEERPDTEREPDVAGSISPPEA